MRLWARSEDSADEDISAPVGIDRILEYSALDGDVPEGVTIPGREPISSREVEPLKAREPGEDWAPL